MTTGGGWKIRNDCQRDFNPSELRWVKADNFGTTISWCYNNENNPLQFSEKQLKHQVRKCAKKAMDACGVILVENPVNCDIDVMWDTVGDGVGMTLAFVFQPGSGNNMAACGVCGPVHIDTAENFSLVDFFNVIFHEMVGHGLGLSHTDQLIPSVLFGDNIMDPFYSFGSTEFELGPSDIEQLQLRYGKPCRKTGL